MINEESLDLLERYRHGELDDADRRALERRLEEDPELAELLRELEADSQVEEELAAISDRLLDRPRSAGQIELDEFRIIEELHRGGQGIIYRAVEEQTHRPVALKLLLSGTHASRRERLRFDREIELAANLQHPNIVAVFHTGVTADGHQYFVMPLIEGVRLDEFVREKQLGVDDTLRLFLKVARAVNYAHQRGIIHRDLKPGNILVDERGEPYVLDFGLAKPFGAGVTSEDSLRTLTGEFAGTLAYASPEQVRGQHDLVEVRSDVYALGVLLYGLLARRHPYRVDGPITEIIDNIVHQIPEKPSTHRAEIDSDTDVIVLKSIAKEIERRYATVAHFGRDIELCLAGLPIEAKSDSGWYILRKTLGRYRLAAGAVALLMLILAAATAVSVQFWRDAEEKRAQAEEATRVAKIQQAQAEAATDRAVYEKGVRSLVSRFAWDLVSSVDADTLEQAASRIDEDVPAGLPRAIVHDQFGMAFYEMQRLDLAEKHLQLAVDLYTRDRDLDELGYRRSRKNLAVIWHARGRLQEAEEEFRSFIAWMDANDNPDHDQLQTATRADLAFLLHDTGRFAEAAKLLMPALDRAREIHGDTARRTQRVRRILGLSLVSLQRLVDAAAILDEALEISVAMTRPDPLEVVLSRNARAHCHFVSGETDRAIELLSQSLADCRSHEEIGEAVLLTTMNNLAGTYAGVGRLEESAELLREVVETQIRQLGREHVQPITTQTTLASVLGKLGRHREAAELLRDVVADSRRALGATHPTTLNAVNSLGWRLAAGGQREEGVKVMGESIALALAADPEEVGWVVHYMRVNRASILLKLERREEAEAELLAAYDGLVSHLGAHHSYARATARTLAGLYEEAGAAEKAERYRVLGMAKRD